METKAHRVRRENCYYRLVEKNGQREPVPFQDMVMTPCRLAILKTLIEFPRLDTLMLYEQVRIQLSNRRGEGLHFGRFKNTLTDLRKTGGYITCPRAQFDTTNADYKKLIYQLTDRGIKALKIPYRSFCPPSTSIFHDWMTCHAIATLKLEAHHEPHLRFMSAEEILSRAPARKEEHPFKFPVTIPWKGEAIEIKNFAPDYAPFGLVYEPPGRKPIYNFFVWETDCDTESVDADPLEGTSLHRKMLAYLELDTPDRDGGDNQFFHRFKMTNNYVCIITTEELQKKRIMKKIEEVCGASEMFLVKVVPHFKRLDYSPQPLAELWHTGWERVGYAPFFLNQPQEA